MLLDAEEVQRLYRAARRSDRLPEIVAFLEAVGFDRRRLERGIDLNALDEAYRVVVHQLVYATPFRTNSQRVRDSRVRRIYDYVHRHTTALTPTQWDDVCWLTARGRNTLAEPGPKLRSLLSRCSEQGYTYMAEPPVCIRPVCHYGRQCGMGLVSLVKLTRGQMICQFTGTVHAYTGKFYNTAARRAYSMRTQYRGRDYVVNPLDGTNATTTRHVAAYINEPSPPPFAVSTGTTHAYATYLVNGRKVRVLAYAYAEGVYTVEFADGSTTTALPEELATEEYPATVRDHTYRANCIWFDFPVPVELYRYTSRKNDDVYVYTLPHQRTNAFTVTYTASELRTVFEAYVDTSGRHRLTGERSNLAPPAVLLLRPNVFDGLHRESVVVTRDSRTLTVRHFVSENVWWRLPPKIAVGKQRRCSACTVSDTGGCTACVRVPFPVVHTCTDVRAGEELLCLYSTPTRDRGLGCGGMDDDALGPIWNMACR